MAGQPFRLLGLCAALAAALTACTITPDVYCQTGTRDGETWREKLADVMQECAPMIRLTVPL